MAVFEAQTVDGMPDVLTAVAPPSVLTIAGSDPSGGAGIQADLATVAAFGFHGTAAITALTVQDTANVGGFQVIEAASVDHQARAVLDDLPIAAIKIGMLGSAENAYIVADLLADYPEIPVVVDPVLVSSNGTPLATEELDEALKGTLFPRTTLLTPNAHEATRLSDEAKTLQEQADALTYYGVRHVLLTGGHHEEEDPDTVTDRLYAPGVEVEEFSHSRLLGYRYHGSGCTLSTAIACGLADGFEVLEAVGDGIEFTFQALKAAYIPGRGQAVPDRFYRWRPTAEEP